MPRNALHQICLALASLVAVAVTSAVAQKNPRIAEPDNAPILFDLPPSPPLSVDDALKTFKLPAGFRIEPVAVEPLVEDPVAAAFDENGRLWVVEMRGYMHDADGAGEDQPIGRVKVLEDVDGDARMDKATVFLDGLYMPRAVLPVMAGALVGEPPELAFWRDTNGDGKADEKTIVSTAYGVRGGQPEYQANSPTLALDNWIYNTGHAFRYRFTRKKWVTEPSSGRGQFGLSQDDAGRLIFCSNSEMARADLLPTHYSRNPFNRSRTASNVGILTDQSVWPSRPNPGVTGGYRPNMLREDGRLRNATSACGNSVYRGGLFGPEFAGNLFVGEPAGNLVKRLLVEDRGGVLAARDATPGVDFLTSTDERFRPVNTFMGPEGALYVVDMYRGILQHAYYVTDYLRRNIERRGLQNPIHLGRIYRVVPDGAAKPEVVKFTGVDSASLVARLAHPNGWARDTAQRLLVERNDGKTLRPLAAMALSGTEPLGRLHALWTLDGMGRLDPAVVRKALADADPRVRLAAVRLCEPQLVPGLRETVIPPLVKLAEDADAGVRLQLALTLSPVGAPAAEDAMTALLASPGPANVDLLRDAVLSGLRGRELEFVERLLRHPAWTAGPSTEHVETLAALARCVMTEHRPSRVAKLVELTAAEKDGSARQRGLMRGMAAPDPAAAAAAARRERLIKLGRHAPDAPPPPKLVYLDQRPAAALDALLASRQDEVAELARALEARLAWPGKPGVAPPPKLVPLTTEQQARFEKGKLVYANLCSGCHQPTGIGQAGLAPPLADSEWVQGPDARLVRVILHGVAGNIAVAGARYNLEMPALPTLADQDVADVLTYVRREWENTADPVDVELVRRVRAETADRAAPWTADELLKVR